MILSCRHLLPTIMSFCTSSLVKVLSTLNSLSGSKTTALTWNEKKYNAIKNRRKRLTQLIGQKGSKTGPIFCQHQSTDHKCYECFRNCLPFVGAFLSNFAYYVLYDTLSLCPRHFSQIVFPLK